MAAASFTALGQGIAWGASKNMFSLYNTSASLVCRIYRVWMTNPQTSNVTGGYALASLGRITSAIAGSPTAVTPVGHNPANTTLTGLTVNHAGTVATQTLVYRTIARPNDEIAAAGATADEIANIVPLNLIWDAGYRDTNVQPITLRENEGFNIRTPASPGTYTGTADIRVEFTFS